MKTLLPYGATFLVAAALPGACAPDAEVCVEEPFSPEYTFEQIRIQPRFNAELCSGTLSLLSDHMDWLDEVFSRGYECPYWVDYLPRDQYDDVAMECGIEQPGPSVNVRGCWDDPVTRGVWEALSHELVQK